MRGQFVQCIGWLYSVAAQFPCRETERQHRITSKRGMQSWRVLRDVRPASLVFKSEEIFVEMEVFIQPLCPYSYALKHLLTGLGVAFVERNIVTDSEARKAFFNCVRRFATGRRNNCRLQSTETAAIFDEASRCTSSRVGRCRPPQNSSSSYCPTAIEVAVCHAVSPSHNLAQCSARII